MKPNLFQSVRFILSVFTLMLLMSAPIVSNAQLIVPRPMTGGAPGSGGLEGPPEVPVDGGLSIVLAVGAGYGAKKLREYRKKSGVQLDS